MQGAHDHRAIALVAGLILSPVLARFFPFGLDGRVAALIVQADRWNASAHLMQAQSPEAWSILMNANQLVTANSANRRLSRCGG